MLGVLSYLIASLVRSQNEDQVPHVVRGHIRDGLGLLGSADASFDPASARINSTGEARKAQFLVAIGHFRALGDEADELGRG